MGVGVKSITLQEEREREIGTGEREKDYKVGGMEGIRRRRERSSVNLAAFHRNH